MSDTSNVRIDLAARRQLIAPYIHHTPLWHSTTLSDLTGHDVWLKCELFQKTGSYKPRGMLATLMARQPRSGSNGAITFSAGNAAQGLAYAGRLLKVPVTVVMPQTASPLKAEATRRYGGEVILHGNPIECLAKAQAIAQERGLDFISSYDDDELMTGHASAGLEIIEDLPEVDMIFVGVGGGGMIGGIAMSLEYSNHPARLFGVEPEGAAAMTRSLAEGRAVTLERVQSIADGLAAPSAGERCYQIVRRRVEPMIVVSDEAIRQSMIVLMTRAKLFAEPAGAASLAGFLSISNRLPSKSHVVVMVSGGNLDPDRLRGLL